MIPKVQQSDFGFYAVRFFDGEGTVILPDLDATLIIEFRDANDTLQFTATLLSTPALVQGLDSVGDFIKVSGIDVSGWALGVVLVSVFSKKNGDDITPSPLVATAFEVVLDIVGYCGINEVKDYSGVQFRDLDLDNESELDQIISSWIAEATDYIDNYTGLTFTSPIPNTVANVCKRITSNMVIMAVQRRKSPLIQIGDFNIQMLEDDLVSDDMKEWLDKIIKQFGLDGTDTDNLFGSVVVLPEE